MSATMEATRTKKTTFVCQFCNAIVATTSGSKDAFEKHMEDSHNILTNLNVVMALHTMTKEEKEKLMRTKRKELEQELGVKVEIGENETTVAEELEENQPTFQYPKLKAKPNEKRSDFLRRRLSVYLIKQGFGRGGIQYGQGKAPFGWPSEKYSWSSFKGTARGCSATMAQDIVSSILNAQGIDPLDLVDDGSFDQSSDSDGDSAEPSLSDEKPKDKTELLKKLKSALCVLGEKIEDGPSKSPVNTSPASSSTSPTSPTSVPTNQRIRTRSGKPLVPTVAIARTSKMRTRSGNQNKNTPNTATVERFRNMLGQCLPKKSSMTTAEIQAKMESGDFPMPVIMRCLSILANDGVMNWANLVVS